MSDRPVITFIQIVNTKQYKVKISNRADMGIGTGGGQWNREKTSTKTSSIDKVKDRREANT